MITFILALPSIAIGLVSGAIYVQHRRINELEDSLEITDNKLDMVVSQCLANEKEIGRLKRG